MKSPFAALLKEARARTGHLNEEETEAFERLLELGHRPPEELVAWLLLDPYQSDLFRWEADFSGLMPSLAQVAAEPWLEDQGKLTTSLHSMVEHGSEGSRAHEPRLEELLKRGANPNAVNSDGVPVLGVTERQWAADLLLAAGANPLLSTNGKNVCRLLWRRGDLIDQPTRLQQWENSLSKAQGEERTQLLFALVETGQHVLMHRMKSAWGLSDTDLDGLVLNGASSDNAPMRDWGWTGWLAFHSLAGLSSSVVHELSASLDRLRDRVLDLPPFDQMWVEVARHAQQAVADPWSDDGAFKIRLKPNTELVDSVFKHTPAIDVRPWALSQTDLPLREGGLTRSEPFRSWLCEGLVKAFKSSPAQELSGACHRLNEFLLEEASGNERMDRSNYRSLRGHVLKHALAKPPEANDPRMKTVLLALMSSLEQASVIDRPNLPDLGAGGGMALPGSFENWVMADWHTAQWDQEFKGAVKDLRDRIRPDLIRQQFGGASPSSKAQSWLGTWDQLKARLNESLLEESFATHAVPSRSKPRF